MTDRVDPLTLGDRQIWPPVVLAPMAGVTDAPYRVMCWRRQAPLCVSEMITARAIVERHRVTLKMIEPHPSEPIRSVQLYGTDPHYLGEAVRYLVDHGLVEHLDLNFGCPVPKVTRLGGGSALPYKRRLFAAMIASAVEAADGLPVTVKFRMGIDDDHLTYLDAGRIAADQGAAWVALHARTAEQLYSPSARWSAISELVEHVDVPVLGNGDIFDASDALAMRAETGCAGVVIGRGCLGKPYLFSDLAAAFAGVAIPPPPRLGEVAAMVLEHANLLVDWRDPSRLPSFRKHIGWYLKGYPIGASARQAIGRVETLDDIARLVDDLDPQAELPEENRRLVRSHTGGPRRVVLPDGWLADPQEDIGRLDEPDTEAGLIAISGG